MTKFVIYQQPNVIPLTKGPFRTDEKVEEALIAMRRQLPAETILTVAEVTPHFELWLTLESEFLTMREVARMP